VTDLTIKIPDWLAQRLADAVMYGSVGTGLNRLFSNEEIVVPALIAFLGNNEPGINRAERAERNREIQALRNQIQAQLPDDSR